MHSFSTPPQVMGILNITPDSFCETGRFSSPESALIHAQKMVEEGADYIDIGAEPTNPGVHPVISLQEELDRVMPVISLLAKHLSIPISVDTSKPAVMEEAIRSGVCFINDVRALRHVGALEVVARHQVRVCLMHMQFPNGIQNISNSPQIDILSIVKDFLEERIAACLKAGIAPEQIVVDPGIGGGSFGKTTVQNCALLARLEEFKSLGFPILIGVSRKSFIGDILGNAPVEQRLSGSLAATVMAVANGAQIIRTHDVKATVDAIKIAQAIKHRASC